MELKKGFPYRNGVKVGYKQTEVGVIPEDWDATQISVITSEVGDGIHSTPIYSSTGEYYFINGNNLVDGKIVTTQDTKRADPSEFKKHKKDLSDRTIFLSINGTIGNLALYAGESIILGKSAAYLNVTKEISKRYIYFSLQTESVKQFFEDGLTGTTIKNLGLGTIRKTPIALPKDKKEQSAIAAALSDADALIQSMEKLIAKKRLIKHGAMQELLKPKEGWVVKKLGEIADICRGASPRPIDSPIWFEEKSKIGWVRIFDVTKSNKFLKDTTQKLSELGIKHSRFINKDNLIMSICATVGRPILTEIDVCIHDGFVVFGTPKIDKEYLYYFLTSIEKDWSKHGQTGSQMNLNTGLINTTPIPFPKEKSEQIRIATILSDMDAEISALESKLAKYKQVKQGMMQNLLTGKIRLV